MTIKQQLITTLTDLKNLNTTIKKWYTADANTDVTAFGTTIPSRAKYLATIKKGDKGDKGDQGIQGIQGVQGQTGPIAPNAVNYAKKDLSNITNASFKAKGVASGLSKAITKLFTQTSGKFFVRNTDGSLPSGIDSSKVWSLSNQKTGYNAMPSGKVHIELPVGLVNFTLAGAGGGGGGHYSGTNGGQGGSSSLLSRKALGGTGGWHTNRDASSRVQPRLGGATGTLSNDSIVVGGGSSGGMSIRATGDDWGGGLAGSPGGLIMFSVNLSIGDIVPFYIGAGGVSGGGAYNGFNATAGANGYIEVEYV